MHFNLCVAGRLVFVVIGDTIHDEVVISIWINALMKSKMAWVKPSALLLDE